MPANLMLIADAVTLAALVLGAYIAFPPQLVSGPPPSSEATGAPRPTLVAALAARSATAVA
jgi:hypothetical protein